MLIWLRTRIPVPRPATSVAHEAARGSVPYLRMTDEHHACPHRR
ncbi:MULTISPECIES: hypothetical protein [Burkholderia]|nr:MULTISPECIES: hypothetical protein [Burkholderia]